MNTQVINFLPAVDEFATNQTKWNSNEEVARILYSAQKHPEWISPEVQPLPPSSSQKLFNRLDGNHFKQDGYEWKKRKEGKLIREDHVKLKVQKQEIIAGSYVHSAVVPSFHRRVYWLIERPDVVLVHYLNVSGEEARDGQPLHSRIAQCVRSSNLNLTQQQLEMQIRSIFCYSTRPCDITSLLANVFSALSSSHTVSTVTPCHAPQDHQVSYSEECSMEGVQVVHLGNGTSFHPAQHPSCSLERSNSCSSAFRRGLSSVAMRRQPSTFSDTVDRQFVVGLLTNYNVERESVPFADIQAPNECCNFVRHRESSTMSQSPATVIEPDSGSSACSAGEMRAHHPAVEASTAASASSASCSAPLIEIADYSPDRSPTKGGTKVLIVGGWYLRGHDYTVVFGDKQVPAVLFHAGVLRCFAPPHPGGVVKLEVYCDGSLISHAVQFEYLQEGDVGGRSAVLAQLMQRLSFVQSCLNTEGVDYMRELPEFDAETVVLEIFEELVQYPINVAVVARSQGDVPANSLLHLCAMLNFHRTIRLILEWRSEISSTYYLRDFDVVARDSEGRTPLHVAVMHSNHHSIQALISYCPSAVDVLDDRGETPQDLVSKVRDRHIALTFKRSIESSKAAKGLHGCPPVTESVNPTALWVMTNGETVTDEQRLQRIRTLANSDPLQRRSLNESTDYSDVDSAHPNDSSRSSETRPHMSSEKSSWMEDPLAMDVHIPDSPNTAHMWNALTSPDPAASEGARARMATLAQQIIDALPARIKALSNSSVEAACVDEVAALSEPSSSGLSVHSKNPFLTNAFVSSSSEWEELISPLDNVHYGFTSLSNFMENGNEELTQAEVGPLDVLGTVPSPSTFHGHSSIPNQPAGNSEVADIDISPTTSTKELGEFFNTEGVMGPLEKHFRNLRLSDREQRELYEAAKIIQHAYRQYKARLTSQRQNEAERNAAVVIQSYYRRYKQFCYFKKLHKAAVLIQKHFRMHRALQGSASLVPAVSANNNCIRMHSPDGDAIHQPLMKEHLAALTIQHAYRGHYQRKRQAAARKIQKFMRQSKQKLRKIHESSGDVFTGVPVTQHSNGSSAEPSL